MVVFKCESSAEGLVLKIERYAQRIECVGRLLFKGSCGQQICPLTLHQPEIQLPHLATTIMSDLFSFVLANKNNTTT